MIQTPIHPAMTAERILCDHLHVVSWLLHHWPRPETFPTPIRVTRVVSGASLLDEAEKLGLITGIWANGPTPVSRTGHFMITTLGEEVVHLVHDLNNPDGEAPLVQIG